MRPETPFIMPETRTYLRDCFDHTVAVLDLVESYREMTNGLMEVYLMQANNRMSEVMKTMAVITVFFLPLTFLTGLYGMNFDRERGNMPELGWQYGYLFFWCIAVAVVGRHLFLGEAEALVVTLPNLRLGAVALFGEGALLLPLQGPAARMAAALAGQPGRVPEIRQAAAGAAGRDAGR